MARVKRSSHRGRERAEPKEGDRVLIFGESEPERGGEGFGFWVLGFCWHKRGYWRRLGVRCFDDGSENQRGDKGVGVDFRDEEEEPEERPRGLVFRASQGESRERGGRRRLGACCFFFVLAKRELNREPERGKGGVLDFLADPKVPPHTDG